MDVLMAAKKHVEYWIAYLSYCWEQPIQAPVCRPIWTWVMIAILAIGAITAITITWKIISYKIKLAAALRAEQERASVDTDAIQARRWDGDKAYSAELGDEEIERRIREAMHARHRREDAAKDHMNIV